jgi:hypothetical protein
MSSILAYLDESGDLGWNFSRPYRSGGSSRYLTIGVLIVESSAKEQPKRLIRNLYKKFKWPTAIEKKWSGMQLHEKEYFSNEALKLQNKFGEKIRYLSITVKKENVQAHIRNDANKLYNYMICCLVLNEISKHETVVLVPDPRSIKVASGNSLHDYLQIKLWFEKQVRTRLTTTPCDSSSSLNVQFSDMLSGLVQGHFEDGNSQPWMILRSKISYKTLFF